jgi:predicted ATP-binding protein involved in virulence
MTARSKRGTFAKQLILENIRSFDGEQVLDLTDGKGNPARWTLLLGDNGVGKTTLLECIVGLTPRFNSADGAGEEDPRLFIEPRMAPAENSDFIRLRRVGARQSAIGACFGSAALLDKDAGAEDVRTSVRLSFADKDEPESLETSRWPEKERDAIPQSRWSNSSKFNEPLVLYYGAGRHMGFENLENRNGNTGSEWRLEPTSEMIDAEEMILQLHYASREPKSGRAKRQKELLLRTIAELLPEVRSPKQIQVFGASAIGEQRKTGVFVRTADGEVPLRELSFGYKTMMSWIGDVALRLFQEYPESSNALSEPVIIVIDEIDLHLHPSWQRELRELLSRHFPNAQFIATAHSPLIAQAFLDANLAVILREGDHSVIENDPVAVANWRVDQIVTSDLFKLSSPWPPKVDALFEEQERISREERGGARTAQLQVLEDKLLDLPTEDDDDDERALNVIREAARKLSAKAQSRIDEKLVEAAKQTVAPE